MPTDEHRPRPDPVDYDSDPDRFRATTLASRKYGLVGDVHEDVADRFAKEQADRVLDIGCGQGKLIGLL